MQIRSRIYAHWIAARLDLQNCCLVHGGTSRSGGGWAMPRPIGARARIGSAKQSFLIFCAWFQSVSKLSGCLTKWGIPRPIGARARIGIAKQSFLISGLCKTGLLLHLPVLVYSQISKYNSSFDVDLLFYKIGKTRLLMMGRMHLTRVVCKTE